MLMADPDATTPLVAAMSFADVLRVRGTGRGGKPRDELLKGAALETHVGKRARKGRVVQGFKPSGLEAA
jgi:topoisomerase-4 subunit A